MAWIEGFRRRIAALWASLLGAFRAPARAELPRLPERVPPAGRPAAPAQVVPKAPPQGDVTIDIVSEGTETAPAPPVAPPPVVVARKERSPESVPAKAPAPSSEPEARKPAPAAAKAPEPERKPARTTTPEPEPERKPARAARTPLVPELDPELALLRVRQFFGRMVLAGPGAQAVDLADWQMLPVERFFLAVGAPRALHRREAPTSGGEAVKLGNAFEGFEWD